MDEVRHYDMSEAELAAHPTVFGEKLMAGQTVMVSGAGRGIGRPGDGPPPPGGGRFVV